MKRSPPSADDLRLAQVLWDFHSTRAGLQPADVAIGLGSYDDRVADCCVDLHRRGLVRRVCFTGASGQFTRGLFPQGEARAFAERALALGLPATDLLVEAAATNTAENIRFARRLLEPLGVGSVILVAKPNMLMRAWATCGVEWPAVERQRACADLALTDETRNPHGRCGLVHELVGDLLRLRSYPERGWSLPVLIPPAVQSACDRLLERGYTGHLPA